MPLLLQVSESVKDSWNLRLLKRMLRYASERNIDYFMNLCKKKFSSHEQLNSFWKNFPTSSFILDEEDQECEHSVFISYMIFARNTLWVKKERVRPIFGKPDLFAPEALTFSRPGA
jgi:hypothetical protein